MKISVYSYDHSKNPRCGGGGAYRTIIIHKLLACRHSISMYFGYFKGAAAYREGDARVSFLGFGKNYLLSRASFALFASVHSLVNKTDLTVIEYSVFSPVLTFLVRPKTTVIQIHHLINSEPFRKYGIFGFLPMAAEWVLLHFSRNMVTSASSVAQLIHDKYPKIATKATYNGVEDSMYYNAQHRDDNVILTLGRLDIHMKGLDILLDAFDRIGGSHTNHTLVLAGRGKEKDILWLQKRIAASPYAPRITLLINISEEEKIQLLRGATLVCMPSRFEGWNIVAIEAAATSKPTIGTDILGLKDTIRNNETGILVPSGDVMALSEAMQKLLTDAALRKQFGENGFRWAKTFCWDEIARNQEQFYRDVLHKNAAVS